MHTSSGRLERGAEIGGYRVDGLIGQGGMGVVYRATNVALNRVYALKLLGSELADDEQFRQRFQREMRIAALLHHPHVVGIHYAGEHDGLLFLAMDYVPGSDLRDLLVKDGAVAPARAVELLTQVASALDAAHGRGLVHRDIKPANILITVRDGEEHAYLTDFGLAKRHDGVSGLTMKGSLIGTVDYMAPEQVTGDPTDARTDIYALGCVFFEMLTGKVPFEREHSVATLAAHVNDPPPALKGPLADSYPQFTPVLERAMAKRPTDRYLSAGDFARDAAAALHGTRYAGAPSVVTTGEARPADETAAAQAHVPGPAPAPDPRPVRETMQPVAGQLGQPTKISPRPAGSISAAVDRGGDGGSRGPLRRYRWPALGLGIVAAIVAAVIIVTSGGASTAQGQLFEAALRPVPTNHVTGRGTAMVRLQGDLATVTVDVTGLLNGSAHLMHIHAFGQGICPPASAARLYNGHLAISASDGIPYYGPMVYALTESGDTSAKAMLAFPEYPSSGSFHYRRTIAISAAVARAIRNGDAEIVVHGIDYNHNGIYDNVLNRSDLDGAVPQEATDPALCGPLFNTQP